MLAIACSEAPQGRERWTLRMLADKMVELNHVESSSLYLMKQLVLETRTPISAQSGQTERFDYQYERNGTANLFLVCNPIEGWRTVEVTQQRTAIDYAHLLKKLVDDYYPEAFVITVVQDNLNTHTPASLYKTFEPCRGQANHQSFGVLLHTQAWQLVKHGRDRAKCSVSTMPQSKNS